MKLEIDKQDIDALQKLREADAPIPVPGLFSAEVLGLVEGSYHGRKGIGTGGGRRRRYVLTPQGFSFMARLDWLKQ